VCVCVCARARARERIIIDLYYYYTYIIKKIYSITWARFVAAMTMMPVLPWKPSISIRSWFSVLKRSSLPVPELRARPTASISSMKMMEGAIFLADAKSSRTLCAPIPTYISTNSEPDTEKMGTPASPATARASSVLPVPGGPSSKTPRGMRAPSAVKRSASFTNSTTSCVCFFV
jgi:hypothetical protein